MFGIDSIWHWVVVLVLVLVFFGTGKLRHAGSDIGAAIRDFRKGMQGNTNDQSAQQIKAEPATTASTPAAGKQIGS